MVALSNKFPGLVPFALTECMARLVDARYINTSFDSYNLGLNQDAGFAEVSFSRQDSAFGVRVRCTTARSRAAFAVALPWRDSSNGLEAEAQEAVLAVARGRPRWGSRS